MSLEGPAESGLYQEEAFFLEVSPFLGALNEKIALRQDDGVNLAVMMIECGVIDRIDAVWGYQVGDAVRNRVTELLRTDVLRPGDILGQMGRDHTALVLSTVDGSAVALLAAQKCLRALSAPFWIGEEEIFASPSIGIAMFPMHGDQAEYLLQRAKSACDMARALSGHIADADADQEGLGASRLLYENRLRTAVSEDLIELVFQPQFDLRRGQVMGAECLLCWSDAAAELISSEYAFAAAESAGMVTDLVSSILNRALRNVSEFRYSGGLDLRIGVKLPARLLLNTELPDVVQRALGTWSRRPGTLILEVGDTALLGANTVAKETLVRLKEVGVKLSIDDSNMALSSLFWLAAMPFQELKVDISALREPSGAPKSMHILRSIVDLAHRLKLDVVAVGVSGEEEEARLKELGYDYMQADFKGPALDPKGFVERFGFSED